MGMKQAIVIKSEYTNNARSKDGGGSRGASPGQYVMRYMAREDATEVLAPVLVGANSYNADAFTRYMTRMDATERLKNKLDEYTEDPDTHGSPFLLKHRFRQVDKLSGRAFGSRGVSLSHDALQASSDTIQEAFDNGHSVQKIILSFSEDYLRETGVLSPDFNHKGRGSYKGQIDQLKLRNAITSGVEKMTRTGRFIEPEWVGTIQLDTSHVHAHLALVDTEFSASRMKPDGADRGKINEAEKKMFRKGIHHQLEDMRPLHSFHQQASLERQNVVAFVKDYAYATIQENTSVQLLIASLPKERNSWRYGSNRTAMKHPNELARGIVEDTFKREPERSGYDQAMASVREYAAESSERNKLSVEEQAVLVANGRERIIERSVNGLYGAIKSLPASDLSVRTPMTDIQSSSDDELIRALKAPGDSEFDPAAFTLRVRGYAKREDIHETDAKHFYDLATEFDLADAAGVVDDTAHVMRLFYEEEQRYHMGIADKYRTFLAFNHPKDRAHVEQVTPVYEALTERFNGLVETEKRTGVKDQVERDAYARDLRSYTFDCFDRGVATLKEWDAIVDYRPDDNVVDTRFVLPVRPKTRAENLTQPHFKSVKALDVHHLGLDYYNKPDARIDATNALVFANAYQSRKDRTDSAQIYVTQTGQTLPELDAAVRDIVSMEAVVDKAVDDGLIDTVTVEDLSPSEERQLFTISPDRSLDVTNRVRETLTHIEMVAQMEEEELE